jgi:DNA-3-methyladenine glycosylase II
VGLEPIFSNDQELAEAATELAAVEPRFGHAIEIAGTPALEAREGGFAALMRAVVGQQVSAAAARAIWKRLDDAGLHDAARVAASDAETLRSFGLSRQKVGYLLGIARANLDYAALTEVSNDEAIARLTALPGIGRWTAEIYAIFALRRTDVMAAGDLALQESTRLLFGLDARPSEAALRRQATAWAPWRSVAARLLWRSYRVLRGGNAQ